VPNDRIELPPPATHSAGLQVLPLHQYGIHEQANGQNLVLRDYALSFSKALCTLSFTLTSSFSVL